MYNMAADDLAEATEGLIACIMRMYVCMYVRDDN